GAHTRRGKKKQPRARRTRHLPPPYATPSSNSSLDYRRSDARIVENGFATSGGLSKSAKVVLGRVLINVQMSGFGDEAEILSSTRALPVVTPMYGPAARCKRTFIELADVRSCINVSGL